MPEGLAVERDPFGPDGIAALRDACTYGPDQDRDRVTDACDPASFAGSTFLPEALPVPGHCRR